MSRGGYRPGAGRPKGTKKVKTEEKQEHIKKDEIKDLLAWDKKAKASMYQEFLWRMSGQPNKAGVMPKPLSMQEKKLMIELSAELAAELKDGDSPILETGNLDAGEFLRHVWNDPKIEYALRIRAAEIVVRGDEGKKGKKGEKADRAKAAGAGKFAAGRPPISVVK
jgi:hypothetical protein